jgi:hypothetical protein
MTIIESWMFQIKITTKLLATCMILALLAIGTAAQAGSSPTPIPFTEGFESTSAWTSDTVVTKTGSGTTPAWSVKSSLTNPDAVPYGSKSANFNSYFCGNGVQARFEYGGVFDFTDYGSLELSFYMNHNNYLVNQRDRVQLQHKIGTADWTNIGSEILRYQVGDIHWDKETVDFSSLAGQKNVQIGLLGIAEFGKNIYIDNISLTGNSPAAVPEASTLIGFGSALAMTGPGMIGWLRRRRA